MPCECDVVRSSYIVSALALVFGIIAYCSPGWVNEIVDLTPGFGPVTLAEEIGVGLVVVRRTVTTHLFVSSSTTIEVFRFLPPTIQTVIVTFPFGWAFAIAGVAKSASARSLLSKCADSQLIKNAYNQAVALHILSVFFLFLSMVIFAATAVPVVNQANSRQSPPGVNKYFFLSSGKETRPFTTGARALYQEPSRARSWNAYLGYSFYFGLLTFLLQIGATVFSFLVRKQSSSASSSEEVESTIKL